MKNLNKRLKKMLKSESGQGATEYILLLVIVVGVAMALKEPIKRALGDKITDIEGGIQGFTAE